MDKINGRNIVMESYDKIKKTLAIAFMHDLDANRPEGKMCLSNGECADIEKAFNEQDWIRLAGYLDKYTESEDERIRKTIVATIEQCPDDFLNPKNRDRMLAYLERQKEQKPAEWSEEDEKMLARIIERGQSQIQMFETGLLPEHIAWLKSLRPSWKPSEEHLSALLAIFNDPNNIGSQTCQLALSDLYEQLKKL